ncbi:hypothetical protein GALMADRAFT_245500 [Galerina marginata CBS 339.88]|uniref:Uncharacterized protein n=1 Tax=Galerina marginata (strain CBS 339.88) TaxID=685588 RepID=A0A067TH97_GALM3|nr:hypothetical protein GALMADRAFT_245500 [Galerina marginata CBS 339.88]
MSPRPILKRASATDPHQYQHQHVQHHPHQSHHHGVHFPPSPSLTRTFTAYSASAYDRSPIVVDQNSCALPERGCPGRTYLLDEQAAPSQRGIAYALDYHPRALAFASASSSNYPPVPQLIPDLSSESDESDGVSYLPGELSSTPTQTFGPHGLAGPYGNGMNNAKNNNMSANAMNMHGYYPCDDNRHHNANDPLAFLPYAPSSPSNYYSPASPTPSHYSTDTTDDPLQHQKARHKRECRHESSRDPDRIPRNAGGDLSLGFSSLSISPPSPTYTTHKSGSPTRKKGVRNHIPVQLPPSATGFGFGMPDDGCLGGF